VEKLDEAEVAEVTVHAPGYEQMLSSSRWEDLPLPSAVIRGVYAKGWERPSKIQAQALPYILRGDHPSLLAQAKNGSGKTGAFGLAMLAAADPA
jgi:ATP-dependent RNA helicase DDX19/DBP5